MTKMNRPCCSTRSFLSISLQYTKMPHNKLYGQGTQRGQGIYPSGSFLLRERAQFLHITWEFSPSGFWVTWPSCCPFMVWKRIQAVASTKYFSTPCWVSLTMPIPFHANSLLNKHSSSIRKIKSCICFIDSSWFISLCVKEVSRLISLTLAVNKHVQQWVCGLLEHLQCVRDL